jgi:hypothetical protein
MNRRNLQSLEGERGARAEGRIEGYEIAINDLDHVLKGTLRSKD